MLKRFIFVREEGPSLLLRVGLMLLSFVNHDSDAQEMSRTKVKRTVKPAGCLFAHDWGFEVHRVLQYVEEPLSSPFELATVASLLTFRQMSENQVTLLSRAWCGTGNIGILVVQRCLISLGKNSSHLIKCF